MWSYEVDGAAWQPDARYGLRRRELRAGETVRVNPDHAVQGIGSQSCGPGVLPEYRLDAEAAEFSFVFSATG
ncbi:hypothetical protein ACFVRD_05820 [Streptomyces sp. NPDC057908]|uniref:hypothetical protein n=1 Tax=Streptomyces sp. NPDC057908 TaxID=3346276 RepID=UPI0036E75443